MFWHKVCLTLEDGDVFTLSGKAREAGKGIHAINCFEDSFRRGSSSLKKGVGDYPNFNWGKVDVRLLRVSEEQLCEWIKQGYPDDTVFDAVVIPQHSGRTNKMAKM